MLERFGRFVAYLLARELRPDLERIERRLEALAADAKRQRKWRAQTRRQLEALLRERYLEDLLADDMPFAATARRFHLFAQNEEDGLVLALLQLAGATTRTFVEIGSGAAGGNCAILAEELGWRGVMFEADAEKAARCARRFGDGDRVRCLHHTVTADNVDQLVRESGLAGEIDVLSLDIDSYDYWVLQALSACSPRLMVLEYNAHFGSELAVTIPHDAPIVRAFKGYHGASLAAWVKLTGRKGYRLLACDPSGTNAFFLRNDLRPEIRGVPAPRAFRPARWIRSETGERLRSPIDVVALAHERGLPLEYV